MSLYENSWRVTQKSWMTHSAALSLRENRALVTDWRRLTNRKCELDSGLDLTDERPAGSSSQGLCQLLSWALALAETHTLGNNDSLLIVCLTTVMTWPWRTPQFGFVCPANIGAVLMGTHLHSRKQVLRACPTISPPVFHLFCFGLVFVI